MPVRSQRAMKRGIPSRSPRRRSAPSSRRANHRPTHASGINRKLACRPTLSRTRPDDPSYMAVTAKKSFLNTRRSAYGSPRTPSSLGSSRRPSAVRLGGGLLLNGSIVPYKANGETKITAMARAPILRSKGGTDSRPSLRGRDCSRRAWWDQAVWRTGDGRRVEARWPWCVAGLKSPTKRVYHCYRAVREGVAADRPLTTRTVSENTMEPPLKSGGTRTAGGTDAVCLCS